MSKAPIANDRWRMFNTFMRVWYRELTEQERGVWLAYFYASDFRTNVHENGSQSVADTIGHKTPKHVHGARTFLRTLGLLGYEQGQRGESLDVTVLMPPDAIPQGGIPRRGVYPAEGEGYTPDGGIGCTPQRGQGYTPQRHPSHIKTEKKINTRGGGAAGGGVGLDGVEKELILCGVNADKAKEFSGKLGLTPALIRFAFRSAEAAPPPTNGKKNPPALLCKWIREEKAASEARARFEAVRASERAEKLIPFVRAGDIAAIDGHPIHADTPMGCNSTGLILSTKLTIPPDRLTLAHLSISPNPPRPWKGKSNAA